MRRSAASSSATGSSARSARSANRGRGGAAPGHAGVPRSAVGAVLGGGNRAHRPNARTARVGVEEVGVDRTAPETSSRAASTSGAPPSPGGCDRIPGTTPATPPPRLDVADSRNGDVRAAVRATRRCRPSPYGAVSGRAGNAGRSRRRSRTTGARSTGRSRPGTTFSASSSASRGGGRRRTVRLAIWRRGAWRVCLWMRPRIGRMFPG